MSNGFVVARGDGALVRLRISPDAKNTVVQGAYGEQALKIAVAAPPVDGKANAEVERFLSRLLRVPRSEVEVVRGVSSRDKTVFIGNVGASMVEKALSGRTH